MLTLLVIKPILAKLRDKAHMANTSLTLQPENRYGSTKIKSEVDELSALGGMTRLVSRRSSSSPSVAASSPASQHSSPPSTVAESSQVYLSQPDQLSSSASWNSFTHIQNFNVNINMGEYYPPVSPDPSVNQGGDLFLYQMSQQQHSQHGGMQQHQQAQGMSIDMSPHSQQSYFGGGTGGYGSVYNNGQYMMTGQMTPSAELTTPGANDLQDSWQNFVAQYKQ